MDKNTFNCFIYMHSLFLIGYKGKKILNNACYIYIKHLKEDERCFNLNDILDYFYNYDVFTLFIIATLRDDMEFEYFITFCLCKVFFTIIYNFTCLS